jgi:hypothetical protein
MKQNQPKKKGVPLKTVREISVLGPKPEGWCLEKIEEEANKLQYIAQKPELNHTLTELRENIKAALRCRSIIRRRRNYVILAAKQIAVICERLRSAFSEKSEEKAAKLLNDLEKYPEAFLAEFAKDDTIFTLATVGEQAALMAGMQYICIHAELEWPKSPGRPCAKVGAKTAWEWLQEAYEEFYKKWVNIPQERRPWNTFEAVYNDAKKRIKDQSFSDKGFIDIVTAKRGFEARVRKVCCERNGWPKSL